MSKSKRIAIDTLQFLVNKPTIETGVNRKINTILEKAQAGCSMIGIIGAAGIGKSQGALTYILTSKNAYYIRMLQSYRSKSLFHELVFLITGQYNQSINLSSTIDYLSELLTKGLEKKLIIIDDAGKLKPTDLWLFHTLRRNTITTTGFAFMGSEYFMDNLLRWREDGKVGIAEFYGQVKLWFFIETDPDQDLFHEPNGVDSNDTKRIPL